MKTPEVQLMEFCWMRGLDYSHIVMYAPAFNGITIIPTKQEYTAHCVMEEAAMEEYYKETLEGNDDECNDFLS